MKPLSKVAPGTLVIQVQIQAVWERGFLFQKQETGKDSTILKQL